MVQNESQSRQTRTGNSSQTLVPTVFAAMGKRRMEELVHAQTEFLDRLQEATQQWSKRMQSEATLASEFAEKLTAARSIPDVSAAYQEWAGRHMEMAADDAKRIFANGQKLAETGARLFLDGWQPNGKSKDSA